MKTAKDITRVFAILLSVAATGVAIYGDGTVCQGRENCQQFSLDFLMISLSLSTLLWIVFAILSVVHSRKGKITKK